MKQTRIRQLYKLLREYETEIKKEQPLAAQIIFMVASWVLLDFDSNFMVGKI